MAAVSWAGRRSLPHSPWWPTATLAWVIVQGLFGKYTVTLKLYPAVVTLHLVGGLLVYIVLAIRSLMGRYTAEEHTGIWQGTLYWHFLGGLWIYLLLFLTVVH